MCYCLQYWPLFVQNQRDFEHFHFKINWQSFIPFFFWLSWDVIFLQKIFFSSIFLIKKGRLFLCVVILFLYQMLINVVQSYKKWLFLIQFLCFGSGRYLFCRFLLIKTHVRCLHFETSFFIVWEIFCFNLQAFHFHCFFSFPLLNSRRLILAYKYQPSDFFEPPVKKSNQLTFNYWLKFEYSNWARKDFLMIEKNIFNNFKIFYVGLECSLSIVKTIS